MPVKRGDAHERAGSIRSLYYFTKPDAARSQRLLLEQASTAIFVIACEVATDCV